MKRDETKRAAEEALRGDAYGATDRELWLDIERRKYARAYLAQCEREETLVSLLQEWVYELGSLAQHDYDAMCEKTEAAIKAIEEGSN